MRKRLWDLAKSRIEIATILYYPKAILPGHRHKVTATGSTAAVPGRLCDSEVFRAYRIYSSHHFQVEVPGLALKHFVLDVETLRSA